MSRSTRYRVIRKLAHGGMAEIFLALQLGAEGFEKPVVLKRILPGLAADPGFVRMLVDEAHIASSLNHSHLVQVLDLGKAQDQFFLVLEFVDGFSLEQVRRRARKVRLKMPLPLQLYIVSALCRGLDYVHRRTRNGKPLGIVHRDVTPQNVLVSREGEVKLADFGIAKAIGRREKSATGVIKGKFAYMSPEQTIGAELDARSDLFSVGTLLYVLSTGQKPFDAATDLDVLMQVRRARYEKPSTLVRDYNPDVERFIARALRADRSKRWQSAEQMADRLDAILVKLGQPTGPAALKRWLETLAARDGVLSPGDVREAAADSEPGTLALVSADLELQNLTPPDEPPDDDEPEEVSTARASMRARTRVAAEGTRMAAEGTRVAAEGTRKQASPLNEAMTVVTAAASVKRESVGTPAIVSGGSAQENLAKLDYELDELLEAAAATKTTLFTREEPSPVPTLSTPQDEGSELGTLADVAQRAPGDFWSESPPEEQHAPQPPAQPLREWLDQAQPDEIEADRPRELNGKELSALAAADATPPLLLMQPTPPRTRRKSGWGRALGRLTLLSVLLAGLTGVGAYFAQPYLPPGVLPSDWVRTVDGWLERAQRSFQALRSERGEL